MFFLEIPHLTYAHYLSVSDSGEGSLEAVALLTEFLQTAEATHNRWRVLEGTALRSLAYWACGRAEEALADLEQAVGLAQPSGTVRSFIDLGPGMANLLRHVARKGTGSTYVHQILAAWQRSMISSRSKAMAEPAASGVSLSAAASRPRSPLIESLTEREMEVLVLLEQKLTNKQIAQRLVIALPTVKRHTSSIYAKPNVRNRTEAVSLAQDLAILS
jgi:LuxR family maltose regulon positive regulatory protein